MQHKRMQHVFAPLNIYMFHTITNVTHLIIIFHNRKNSQLPFFTLLTILTGAVQLQWYISDKASFSLAGILLCVAGVAAG